MKKIKAWYVHTRRKSQLHGLIVLENGWTPFQQVVPQVGLIPQLLWDLHPARQQIFEAMGYELEFVAPNSVHVSEIPKGILENNARVVLWEDMAKEYVKQEKLWMKENAPLSYEKKFGPTESDKDTTFEH